MFTANTPSKLPYSTKSSLQALLRSRRELLSVCEKLPENSFDDKHLMRNLLNVAEKNIVNFKSNDPSDEDNFSSDIDQNGDFTYSQKLFHIADGNLYSIFSPLQGRSYGMKPSFLRKQKCTVQECRGRGRKVLRKGLKFHNFLPSESVTSEKGNASVDDQWKVHSECKLKEEHGTKQITVSNWFHNVKNSTNSNPKESASSSEELLPLNETVLESEDASLKSKSLNGTTDTLCDFEDISTSSVLIQNQEGYFDPLIVKNSPKLLKGEKRSFLNNLLLTVSNSHISQSSSPETSFHRHVIVCDGQKHRRKPEQTRRIVPYTKYLSLMEEKEVETGPLDLSLHSSNNFQTSSTKLMSDNSNHIKFTDVKSVTHPVPNVYNKSSESFVIDRQNAHVKLKKSHNVGINNAQYKPVTQSSYSSTSDFTFPSQENSLLASSSNLISNDNLIRSSKQNYFTANTLGQCFNVPKSGNTSNISYSASSHQNSCAKYNETSRIFPNAKPRKRSQRSVIKQKLEDTFKQNGFLVKTKQVSDGEATFCKFRQLRKYTRYYLKSWQQHLPDEVHKMWKGFLPPKTVLPPISGTVTPSSNEAT